MKAGLEGRHQRNLGQLFAQQPHRRDVGRIVGRRDRAHLFHRRQHVGVTRCTPLEPAAVHRLEADGRHFRRIGQAAELADRSVDPGSCRTAAAWSGTCDVSSRRATADLDEATALRRADPLDAAARKLALVGHVE